jgi:hypothetical protein
VPFAAPALDPLTSRPPLQGRDVPLLVAMNFIMACYFVMLSVKNVVDEYPCWLSCEHSPGLSCIDQPW